MDKVFGVGYHPPPKGALGVAVGAIVANRLQRRLSDAGTSNGVGNIGKTGGDGAAWRLGEVQIWMLCAQGHPLGATDWGAKAFLARVQACLAACVY